ncbi:MAG: hypothetical protein IJV70_03410 [Clostridia bacterium]|nr:hypothetical protein [Clostridia bacterium]
MKKHLSVFGLFARSSIYKIIGVILLISAAQAFFFRMELDKALKAYEAVGSGMATLEKMLARGAFGEWLAAGFIVITVFLCLTGHQANTGYTIQRLSVSEKLTFIYQGIYNTLIYVILAASQIVLAYFLCKYYVTSAPQETVSDQTLFLAFYRNQLLHGLLPLEDTALWIRNVLLAICLGFTAAQFPYKFRRGKFEATVIAMAMYVIVYFRSEIGDIFRIASVSVIALMIGAEIVFTVFMREDEEEEEDGSERVS